MCHLLYVTRLCSKPHMSAWPVANPPPWPLLGCLLLWVQRPHIPATPWSLEMSPLPPGCAEVTGLTCHRSMELTAREIHQGWQDTERGSSRCQLFLLPLHHPWSSSVVGSEGWQLLEESGDSDSRVVHGDTAPLPAQGRSQVWGGARGKCQERAPGQSRGGGLGEESLPVSRFPEGMPKASHPPSMASPPPLEDIHSVFSAGNSPSATPEIPNCLSLVQTNPPKAESFPNILREQPDPGGCTSAGKELQEEPCWASP